MPGEVKQISFRLDEDMRERAQQLKGRIADALGLPRLSDPQFFHLLVTEMEKKYPPPAEPKGKK